MGIVVFGATFVDIKGYPIDPYIPAGRNVGRVLQVHGCVVMCFIFMIIGYGKYNIIIIINVFILSPALMMAH